MSIRDYNYQQVIPLTCQSGDSYAYPITITTGDYPSTTPLSIVGWTFNLVLKLYQADPISAAVLNISVTAHLDALNGLTVLAIPAATTATLSGKYYYYMSWVDPHGGIQTFQTGIFTFTN